MGIDVGDGPSEWILAMSTCHPYPSTLPLRRLERRAWPPQRYSFRCPLPTAHPCEQSSNHEAHPDTAVLGRGKTLSHSCPDAHSRFLPLSSVMSCLPLLSITHLTRSPCCLRQQERRSHSLFCLLPHAGLSCVTR